MPKVTSLLKILFYLLRVFTLWLTTLGLFVVVFVCLFCIFLNHIKVDSAGGLAVLYIKVKVNAVMYNIKTPEAFKIKDTI